jgi:hypothetical protein
MDNIQRNRHSKYEHPGLFVQVLPTTFLIYPLIEIGVPMWLLWLLTRSIDGFLLFFGKEINGGIHLVAWEKSMYKSSMGSMDVLVVAPKNATRTTLGGTAVIYSCQHFSIVRFSIIVTHCFELIIGSMVTHRASACLFCYGSEEGTWIRDI